jgi:Leucine-rich repeat (LRR) protein
MVVHPRSHWQIGFFLLAFLGIQGMVAYAQVPGLCEALDNCNLKWATSGDAPWFPQKAVVYSGDSAASSGKIGNNQSSILETTITGPGALSFYWKVSSEDYADYLIFYLDGVPLDKISGQVDWQQKSYSIPLGTHVLRWTYLKDQSGTWGADAGWLDLVDYVAIPPPDNPPAATISSPANGVTVSGTVSIQASATDDNGVSKLELYIDGSIVATCAASVCAYTWDTLSFSNDKHVITALAYDTINQIGQAQVTVRVYNLGSLPGSERDALVALYNSTNGASWNNRNNWLKNPGTECTWFGVSCNSSGTHVIDVSLYGNNLVGNLPSQLSNLTQLISLNLSGNFLSGAIPPELGALPSLNKLDVSNNQLSGGIPAEIGNLSNLASLNLSGNRLAGSLPPQLGNLASLVSLQLSQNQLSGSIPSQLGDLSHLRDLSLNDNRLSGSVPTELGNLLALNQLSLSSNQLSGAIPPQLGNLPNLVTLQLHKNQLSGIIPYQLGQLTKLQILELYSNQLVSNIPSDLGNLKALAVLHLEENQLGGQIPAELGNLKNLVSLRLSNNQLTDGIPSELGKLTNLSILQLSSNNLTDAIPVELGDLAALTQLELHHNHLTGQIPAELGKLVKLTKLYLSGNQLTGRIPAEMGELVLLQNVNLSNNQLSGPIPAAMGTLTALASLELESNQLISEIPKELTSLSSLRYLDLRWNALYSSNDAVNQFLDNLRDKYGIPEWRSTQTVAPTAVKAVAVSSSEIQITWTPIQYVTDGGGYRVLYSSNHLGPYLLSGTTAGKLASSFRMVGLPYSATPYYIVVQTLTNAHKNNQSPVLSEYSIETSASTLIQDYPPTVALISPVSGAILSGTVALQANASDDKGIAKVEFLVDGVKVAEASSTPYTGTWDAGIYTNGKHVVSAKAYDTLNQTAESQVSVTVSNPAGSLNTWLLPSSARILGALGGLWTTDLEVSNVGTSDASFTLKFLGNNSDGHLGPEVPFKLAAGASTLFPDILFSVFGTQSGFGSILLNSTSPDLAMASQTSIPGHGGTFGQSVPAFSLNDLIDTAAPRSLLGVREDAAFRSNLVLASFTEQSVQVDAQLLGSSGAILATKSYVLPPLGMTQINRVVRDMGLSDNITGARLVLSTSTSGGKFAAFVSVIDNITNDPRTLLPQSGPALLLPSSARITGFGGGLWITDLTVANSGSTQASATLKFLGNNMDGRNGPEASLTLGAGETLTLPDVLHTVFGLDSGFGPIQLKSASTSLIMQSQTYTPVFGGTMGQSVPAVPPGGLATASRVMSILGIQENTGFRTNLILANATEAALRVEVQLVSVDGTILGTKTYMLQPLGMTQVNRIVRDLGINDALTGARLVLSTSTPGGAFASFATAIDNVTNDPRTLLPQ